MLNRIVPFLAILCIIIVTIMSFFLWRDAENEPQAEPSTRVSPLQKAELTREHAERAEEYARRAEAAALRAETLLETLLLVEARLAAKHSAAPAESADAVQSPASEEDKPAAKVEAEPAATPAAAGGQ